MTTRKQLGFGAVGKLTPVKGDTQANLAIAVASLFDGLNALIDAFNGRISLGDGTSFAWTGNLDAVEIEWSVPAAPNTEFVIPHLLGRVPVRVEVVRKDRACDVYDSGTVWTNTLIYLKCNVASALVLLRIS